MVLEFSGPAHRTASGATEYSADGASNRLGSDFRQIRVNVAGREESKPYWDLPCHF